MPNSRFPVIEDDIDHIIGSLYLKDAILFHMKEQFNEMPVSEVPHLLREVKFIPETVDVDDLFREMQESRKQMVIVVDEYGQTSGLVTMEDILEEIVGNILDEYDKEEKLIARARDGMLRLNGKALLADVSKALDVELDQENYDTISGYLTEKLGHIPTQDDRGCVIEDPASGYKFRVISISGTMFGWLEAEKLPELSDTADDNS
jgi:putative hemolysin